MYTLFQTAKPWMPVYQVKEPSGNNSSIFGNLSEF